MEETWGKIGKTEVTRDGEGGEDVISGLHASYTKVEKAEMSDKLNKHASHTKVMKTEMSDELGEHASKTKVKKSDMPDELDEDEF